MKERKVIKNPLWALNLTQRRFEALILLTSYFSWMKCITWVGSQDLYWFCLNFLFVFFSCWLVGFRIFIWRKTEKNITMALFLFNILKLLWPNCCTSTSVLNGLVSHIWEQLYINLRKIRFNIFYFSSYLCFILLYFISYVKYWSKVAVDLEFWKYNTFCLLTHI